MSKKATGFSLLRSITSSYAKAVEFLKWRFFKPVKYLLLIKDGRGHSSFPEMVMILAISVVTLLTVGLLKIYFPVLVNDAVVFLVIVTIAVPIGGAAYYWAAKRQKRWMIETLNAWIYWLRNGLPLLLLTN